MALLFFIFGSISLSVVDDVLRVLNLLFLLFVSLAGKKLANSIVQEKLAPCVNIVPGIESVYEWEGKVSTEQ
jgi:succinate-acetate transporter protein